MERLFVYGSLQPGGPNEHVFSDLAGTWERATLKGRLVQSGWGAAIGFPGVVLDEFEGEVYERVLADVSLRRGCEVRAHVYALKRCEG